MRRRPDPALLAAGLAVAALGAVLVTGEADGWDLRFGVLGPLVLAAVGVILLASGLSRRP